MNGINRQIGVLIIIGVFFLFEGQTTAVSQTEDEINNISIYSRVGLSVLSITSVVVERDLVILMPWRKSSNGPYPA